VSGWPNSGNGQKHKASHYGLKSICLSIPYPVIFPMFKESRRMP
jgi:hypothetical protein